MKLLTRLLLIIPFIVVTYVYLRFTLADSGCSGLLDLFWGIICILLFAVSIWLAFRGTFHKREINNGKPEPITLTITLATLVFLIVGKFFGQYFKGSTWIYAKANTDKLETQALTLRKNGTFKVDLSHVDYSCYFSGNYQKLGDTIVLDKDVITQTNSQLTFNYLLQDTLLIPIKDTNADSTEFSMFIISSKN